MFAAMPKYELLAFLLALDILRGQPGPVLEAQLIKLVTTVGTRMAGPDPSPLSGAWS